MAPRTIITVTRSPVVSCTVLNVAGPMLDKGPNNELATVIPFTSILSETELNEPVTLAITHSRW
ncbi:hypothetical protein P4V61_17465 [Bacillus thuringiensis]|nr:hypothetical protein [Bacillus thuringiensis]HDR6823084.1 hypothetical protein [Bacillus thuringiensis]